MAKLKLQKAISTVKCDCGLEFTAEDFEPCCPYCGRKYNIVMFAAPKIVKLKISPISLTSEERHT